MKTIRREDEGARAILCKKVEQAMKDYREWKDDPEMKDDFDKLMKYFYSGFIEDMEWLGMDADIDWYYDN